VFGMDSLDDSENRELLKQILIELRQSNQLSASIINGVHTKRTQFYGLETAATKLEVSTDTLQYLTRPNNVEVPFAWLGREKRFSDDDLELWYHTRRVSTMLEIRAEILARKNSKK
jgi:hypothetical protein